MQYKDLISVAPRFTRAVSLGRDAGVPSAIDGYILTVTARDVLKRLVRGLVEPAGHRAWTLTGPYGSGKSALALFLASLFGPSGSPSSRVARAILQAQCGDIHRDLFDRRRKGNLPARGFCPVLVTGSSEPLLDAVLRASCRDIRRYADRGRPSRALLALEKFYADQRKGRTVAATSVIEALQQTAHTLQESGRSQGIFLIVDELGKFLEFAAHEPGRGDIYVLQQLAEATASFKSPGLYLVTILHQSFERYATGLRPAVRDEWSKVQGRFEDVAFQEPPEALLDILAHAINHTAHPLGRALESKARALAERAFELGLAPRGLARSSFVNQLTRCAPLHPLSVLGLLRLCRKFGQNQRSLFSFLVSREPHGFSNFLQEEVSKDWLPFYCLAGLYDYVEHALGPALSVGESATRWVEVQNALDRCVSASPDEIRFIKTVGVLSAVGVYGELKASGEVLEFSSGEGHSEISRLCSRLLKRSVVVYRKHSQAFALWEGSDIDIDGRLQMARQRLNEGLSLARRLSSLSTPRPLVAKRHSFQTGTLRYFAVRFADFAEFHRACEPEEDADGLVVYCLPASQAEFEQLVELAKSAIVRDRLDVLVAIPREVTALREAARDLECLRWVENNTPELKGDAVARRELRARLAIAEERVAKEIQALFSPSQLVARTTLWFHRGIQQDIPNSRSLAHFLSDICDVVYLDTPRLRNELINRRSLSSAAAAARRNLIEAMIANGGSEKLGFAGTPPEVSMYVSVLGATRIHRYETAGWVFGPPRGDNGLLHVWEAIESFFAACELQRRPVAELFSVLQLAPYGLKMGVIPILFCAAVLTHDTEIALYEDDVFIPELTVEVFERLLRSSEKFQLRRYRIVGVRKEVFRRFAELFGGPPQVHEQHLISVVRPLYRFFNRLPEYSRKTTTVSVTAQAVRTALFAAREPDSLLFEELPRACGTEPFLPSDAKAPRVEKFFKALRGALVELQRAYDDLLAELEQLIFRAFSAPGPKPREAVRFRVGPIAEHAIEPKLRAFMLHLCEDQLEDARWIEAIGTLLVGKTPKTWSDSDRARFEVNLAELVRAFRHIEALVFEQTEREKAGTIPAEVLRIGITDRHSKEREAVVVVEPTEQSRVAEGVIRVEECLDKLGISANPELALAVLGISSRRFLSEREKPETPTMPKKQASTQEVGRE
jgi:hypothetical protein